MTSRSASPRSRQAGFTLIELMVALVLSLILAIVLLRVQSALSQQQMRTNDLAERDNELRAAFDMITQDLSSTAFLFGNQPTPCGAIITYEGTLSTNNFLTRHQIDAIPAATGAVMGFATSLSLNYPPAGVPSDVLAITTSSDSTNFNLGSAPILTGLIGSTTNPYGTGVLQFQPASNNVVPAAGNSAIVQVSIANASGTGTRNACLRVPVTTIAGNTITSSGTLMPPTFYAGFQPSLTADGFGPLLNPQLVSPATKIVDAGPPGSTKGTQTTTAFYIDKSGNFPVLMRAQYSLLDDKVVGTPQQIAAGVISLQVRFKITNGTYLTAAAVTAAQAWDQVNAVRVALITRSLYDDPTPGYTWTPTALTPGDATTIIPGAPFANVPLQAGFLKRRYLLQQQELAVRNWLWCKQSSTC